MKNIISRLVLLLLAFIMSFATLTACAEEDNNAQGSVRANHVYRGPLEFYSIISYIFSNFYIWNKKVYCFFPLLSTFFEKRKIFL